VARLSYDRETGLCAFETEELTGVIRPGHEKPHHGLTGLRHRRTGVEFVHPKYSIMNVYRFLAVDPGDPRRLGRELGAARTEPHQVEVDGTSVRLRWPPNEQRRLDTTFTYTVEEPNAVDMRLEVRAEGAYDAFEVFLAGYFEPGLKPHVYLRRGNFELKDRPGKYADEPELVPVAMNDVFRGGILVYPRDEPSARIQVDGRWDGIARFSPVRHYHAPVCLEVDPDRRVASVFMGLPDEVFSISTGYDSPDLEDRFKYHNPQYLSFFGDGVAPGDVRTARARLVVTELDDGMARPLELYRAFAGA
jgi:hypothetical protein